MKKGFAILISILALGLTACGGGGGSPGSGGNALTDNTKINGQYWLGLEDTDNGDIHYYELAIKSGKVHAISIYFPTGNLAHGFYRKYEGTYKVKGDIYTVDWSYETCDPSGTEVFEIKTSDPSNTIAVKQDSTSIIYKNVLKHEPPLDSSDVASLTEDVDCDKFP